MYREPYAQDGKFNIVECSTPTTLSYLIILHTQTLKYMFTVDAINVNWQAYIASISTTFRLIIDKLLKEHQHELGNPSVAIPFGH